MKGLYLNLPFENTALVNQIKSWNTRKAWSNVKIPIAKLDGFISNVSVSVSEPFPHFGIALNATLII